MMQGMEQALRAFAFCAGMAMVSLCAVADARPFGIRVVDAETSRGIPLVTLETMLNTRHVTDSNGLVAFDLPVAMYRDVFFRPTSDGYVFDAPGLAMGGTTLQVAQGSSKTLVMRREMIAERLYRITGAGIYRDSLLLGVDSPLDQPLLNAGVVGQDSALCTVYSGKLFWIWGDTSSMRHPLGNFRSTGARSELPGSGGLDVERGINLNYLEKDDFVQPMVEKQEGDASGMYWMSCLMTARDRVGGEHVLAIVDNIEGPTMRTLKRRIMEFDPEFRQFLPIADWPTSAPVQPKGHAVKAMMDSGGDGKVEYFIFTGDGQQTRVRATYDDAIDPTKYESFTCLKDEDAFTTEADRIERDGDGRVKFSWKKNRAAVGALEQAQLVDAGVIKAEDCVFRPVDANSGKPFKPHACSIAWNDYRQRWTMVLSEIGGTSFLGEAWYLEAPEPTGPWRDAVKILTHDKYTFYNPLQHPELTPKDSRYLYFEGTYSKLFSGVEDGTPWYDYNQVMYRVDLDDDRLKVLRK